VRRDNTKVALYSIAGHPLDINEMCVAGRNRKVLVYDRRKAGPNAEPTKVFGLTVSVMIYSEKECTISFIRTCIRRIMKRRRKNA